MYELKQLQYDLESRLRQHTEADEKFAITVNYLLNLASRAYELFESSKVEQKRQLTKRQLTIFTFELGVKRRKVRVYLK